jgi:hypothetical protein
MLSPFHVYCLRYDSWKYRSSSLAVSCGLATKLATIKIAPIQNSSLQYSMMRDDGEASRAPPLICRANEDNIRLVSNFQVLELEII